MQSQREQTLTTTPCSDLAKAAELSAGEEMISSAALAREIGTTPATLRVKRATTGTLFGVPLPKGRRTPGGHWFYARTEVEDFRRRLFPLEATTTTEADRKARRQGLDTTNPAGPARRAKQLKEARRTKAASAARGDL